MKNNILTKVLAIIVLYEKDGQDAQSLISLDADLSLVEDNLDLFIYDNSQKKSRIPIFNNINIEQYVWDPTNPGVSKAYNVGVQYAKTIQKEWVLLLDQDTDFKLGVVSEYINAIENSNDIRLFCPILYLENFTIFSPFRKFFKRGFTIKNISPGILPLNKYAPVNSGMLLNTDAFLSSGGYNENVPLDFSDFEFIRKFSKKNRSFMVLNCSAIQNFSNEETDPKVLNARFRFFCIGIKYSIRHNYMDHIQFLLVAAARTFILTKRTKKMIFVKTLYQEYLKR